MRRRQEIRLDVTALALLVVAVFLMLSLGTYDPADPPTQLVYPARAKPANLGGAVGATAAHVLFSIFGLGAYLLTAGVAVAAIMLFVRAGLGDAWLRAVGSAMSLAAFCIVAAMLVPGRTGMFPVLSAGGYVGVAGATLLESYFSPSGMWLLVGATLLAGLLLVGDYLAVRLLALPILLPWHLACLVAPGHRGATAPVAGNHDVDSLRAAMVAAAATGSLASASAAQKDEAASSKGMSGAAVAPIRVKAPTQAAPSATDTQEVMAALEAASQSTGQQAHALPPLDMLAPSEPFPYDLHEKQVRRKALILEKTFQDFGYNVKVVEIDTGPVITQFEIELEAGLRLSKIMSLADDLAIALRVPSVRVVAPIPGKNTVGIEVPNDKRALVRLREVIETSAVQAGKMRIPIFLGKDVSGNPLLCDLTEMPHLLIAGRTGTGKSVCLNTMILSILMTRGPDAVRLLMIDPKMVELSPYKRVPHLMHPVVTDMKKAEALLAWAVDKMEERYDILARTGVRHVDVYNQLGRDEIFDRLGPMEDDERARIPERMPYIVIFGDEIADLMMTAPKEVEGHIIRLAQKSRAVGIHLVLATQKPTVDVITGLIKSNLPARIAFQVASRSDSRVVLDEMGADKLLSGGDLLFLLPGTSTLIRAQGTYVSDDEVNRVVDCLSTGEPQYAKELMQLKPTSDGTAGPGGMRERDDLYEAAVEIVIREGRGSVSLLQRALGIGYGRSARLIDYMAEDGIVGDYNGSQAREVLITPEQWRAMQGGTESPVEGHRGSIA